MENQQQIRDMRVQLSEVQGQHKEAMNQLGERATLAAKLQSEISRVDKQNQSLSQEVSQTYASDSYFLFLCELVSNFMALLNISEKIMWLI